MNKKLILKIFIPLLSIILIVLAIVFINFHNKIYRNNINPDNSEEKYFYIHSGSDFDDVCDSLFISKILIDQNSFFWLAEKKNYKNHIHPGRYLITANMSNNELINMLRSGDQKPVKLVINNIRTKNDLSGIISGYLETDSITILKLLSDEEFLSTYGYNDQNVMTVFLPNTYEFFWNTSAKSFYERMINENDRFWTKARLNKAGEIALTSEEISILASIVQQETTHMDEMPEIAGVYINRLKRGMLLQADPTVIFALGDFSKKRVLKKDTKTDSPYNTYKHVGLPPGPICLPEPSTIDQVLNYKQHKYLYFCAKDDLSGYHNFSKTLREHLRYARKYQRAINKLKIRK
ncbi:MAG: endolytic transglycosylase MltG [Bacteroidales bacterium]|nr:endolytic transglycosylase MltG [Bacteroidales bacterium]